MISSAIVLRFTARNSEAAMDVDLRGCWSVERPSERWQKGRRGLTTYAIYDSVGQTAVWNGVIIWAWRYVAVKPAMGLYQTPSLSLWGRRSA